jgi:hypothetical protein
VSAIPVTAAARPDPPTALHNWFSAHDGLVVVALRNPVLDALGHLPTSAYSERYWLPTIGPSATWLYRNLAAGLERHPEGYPVHLPTLAREIGLGAGTGRSAPLVKTLVRLVDFQLAEVVDGQFAVRPKLPPLTRRQSARLPEHLADRHRREALVPARGGLSVEVEP